MTFDVHIHAPKRQRMIDFDEPTTSLLTQTPSKVFVANAASQKSPESPNSGRQIGLKFHLHIRIPNRSRPID